MPNKTTRRRPKRLRAKSKPLLTIQQILQWADSQFERTGRWPNRKSGRVHGVADTTWYGIERALVGGHRGLPGGSSLSMLLLEHRGARHRLRLPRHTIQRILDWADAHHARTGTWPKCHSGPIAEAPWETWSGVQVALMKGGRGLPAGLSLPKLLYEHRGVRNVLALPRLQLSDVLGWADAHRKRTGAFPTSTSGPVAEALGETWLGIDKSLRVGRRGLPAGSSLAQLLFEKRGKRNCQALGPYTIERILEWVDAHHKRTGRYPRTKSGAVADAPGETWMAIQTALHTGVRGLPGGSSLPKLLKEHRGFARQITRPQLTIRQIVAWADIFFARKGRWPTQHSGAIAGAAGETWRGVNQALYRGRRGLTGGSSLSRLLAERRAVRNATNLRPLTVRQILEWADAHQRRTGKFPKHNSGPVATAQGEMWSAVDKALLGGHRGLPGGSSLPKLLAEHRGVRNHGALPRYTVNQILAWADAHHARHGRWPSQHSGAVDAAPGETWARVQQALYKGGRGLRGGSTLVALLAQRRGVRRTTARPLLSEAQILEWADAFRARTGAYPLAKSGPIEDSAGETWSAVEHALTRGNRGLPGGSSLVKLLRQHRRVRRTRSKVLNEAQILQWADAYRALTGAYPSARSGPIAGATGETWSAVDHALASGTRGLPGGSTLAKLLGQHRRKPAAMAKSAERKRSGR
ncbi:MAG TPA: hypothetical protein VND64_13960 [Pirellulales bacterium]|nr:hypothetical protein [Pirellulales bacterium]